MCQASRTKSSGALRADLDQRLRLPRHHDDRSILQHQPVAVAQHHRLREIEQQPRALLAGQHDAPPLAVVGIEHDAVDRAPNVPADLTLM